MQTLASCDQIELTGVLLMYLNTLRRKHPDVQLLKEKAHPLNRWAPVMTTFPVTPNYYCDASYSNNSQSSHPKEGNAHPVDSLPRAHKTR